MLFVCHPKILYKHCLQSLLGVKMAPRETENLMLIQNFGVTNKEHYGLFVGNIYLFTHGALKSS